MNIRSKILSSFTVFIFGLIVFTANALAATPKVGTLLENTNLRAAASSSKILEVLPKKSKITIISETKDWYQILDADGTKGWVIKWLVGSSTEVKLSQPTPNPSKEGTTTAKLTDAVRVRKTPKIASGNIAEVLYPGVTVEITGQQADWYAIKYGANKTGWISQTLVTLITAPKQLAASTSTPKVRAALVNYPSFVSTAEINEYWLTKVNALRQAKGARLLTTSQRLIETATEWVNYLGENDKLTHVRPSGQSAQTWINDRQVPFTERNSVGGWKTNYFTENIGLRLNVQPNLAAVKTAMDGVLNAYLNEGPSGVHYKSLYYPDWNSLGAGWHPIRNSNGTYTLYFVFHYGSLVL